MTTSLAFDPGYGNAKFFGPKGGFVMPSAVSVGGNQPIRRMTGLRVQEPPLRIETDAGSFHVGTGTAADTIKLETVDAVVFDHIDTGIVKPLVILFTGQRKPAAVYLEAISSRRF